MNDLLAMAETAIGRIIAIRGVVAVISRLFFVRIERSIFVGGGSEKRNRTEKSSGTGGKPLRTDKQKMCVCKNAFSEESKRNRIDKNSMREMNQCTTIENERRERERESERVTSQQNGVTTTNRHKTNQQTAGGEKKYRVVDVSFFLMGRGLG